MRCPRPQDWYYVYTELAGSTKMFEDIEERGEESQNQANPYLGQTTNRLKGFEIHYLYSSPWSCPRKSFIRLILSNLKRDPPLGVLVLPNRASPWKNAPWGLQKCALGDANIDKCRLFFPTRVCQFSIVWLRTLAGVPFFTSPLLNLFSLFSKFWQLWFTRHSGVGDGHAAPRPGPSGSIPSCAAWSAQVVQPVRS